MENPQRIAPGEFRGACAFFAGEVSVNNSNRYLVGALALVLANATWAQSPSSCKIDPIGKASRGETIGVKMHIVNDGTPCPLSVRVGGGHAESISIVEQPTHGRVQVDEGAVRYVADPGNSGQDAFLVAWFGHGTGVNVTANFRTRVEVDVRAKP